ncbi:MAG: DUF559 domain-containing protein [Phaeodactylibacter sp.]|nr:DUF559 domain-containing protein [Phaeodactylibacter sp.]
MEKASPQNNYHYNKRLQPYANSLRKNMTKAEACLWKYVLGSRQMKGYQFRRQRPVLNYIADFMCKELLLVVEVDGITHDSPEGYERDQKKDKDLEGVGFTVLRFSDWEVLNKIADVSIMIGDWIEENAICPPPAPRQRGR